MWRRRNTFVLHISCTQERCRVGWHGCNWRSNERDGRKRKWGLILKVSVTFSTTSEALSHFLKRTNSRLKYIQETILPGWVKVFSNKVVEVDIAVIGEEIRGSSSRGKSKTFLQVAPASLCTLPPLIRHCDVAVIGEGTRETRMDNNCKVFQKRTFLCLSRML